MKDVTMGSYTITGGRMFIIAEAGVNHDGDFKQALQLVRLAKQAGADAVKFQAFRAETLCDLVLTEDKDVEHITGKGRSSFEMYKALELSDNELRELKACADNEGILFFASVFDIGRARFLHELGVECFKISSGDITFFPLLRFVASLGRPIILSTGMATLAEVKNAVAILEDTGNHEIVLLHCTSDYPPRPNEIDLNAIKTMRDVFSYPIGYSDHTRGYEIPFALAGMQVPVLEKHFTVNTSLPGPDHKLSLGPQEFAAMVNGIRTIEQAMGSYDKRPTVREQSLLLTTRRGIKAGRDLNAGATLRLQDIRIIKPMSGLAPEFYESLDGKKLVRSVKANDPIEKDDIQWDER